MRAADVRRWTPVLVLAAGVIAIAAFGAELQQALRYERDTVLRGEAWRLLSANLVHLGPAHAAFNLIGLALIFALMGKTYGARQWIVILLACSLSTTVGLLVFQPQIAWYVGLSGALHGAFAAGGLAEARRGHRRGYLWLALLGAKLAADFAFGPTHYTAAWIGGDVVVTAHLFGALGGVVGLAMIPQAPELNRHSDRRNLL